MGDVEQTREKVFCHGEQANARLYEFVHVRSQGDFGKRPSDEEVVSFTLDEHVRIWRVVWKGDSSARGENGRFQMRVGRKKNSYPNAPLPNVNKEKKKEEKAPVAATTAAAAAAASAAAAVAP